ncbi:MAG: GNAT family N-acetyltransferase, partial [Limnohabitans sp.]|nr:GNAT family N-acetyltransferase [Limnohabitans sp.]
SIALVDIGDGLGVVRKMFVAADRRGREGGLAQRLLDVLTAHAADSGMRELWLGTTEKFLAAHRFYERNGFNVIGQSAAASRENFDQEIGRSIAYGDAREKIWPLEGYLLKQRLAGGEA